VESLFAALSGAILRTEVVLDLLVSTTALTAAATLRMGITARIPRAAVDDETRANMGAAMVY
jgi:hypothetical protein